MASEWANKMVLANSIGEGWSLGEMDFIARMLDAARKHGRSESLAEIVELRKDKERLETANGHLATLASERYERILQLERDIANEKSSHAWTEARLGCAIDAARKGEPK